MALLETLDSIRFINAALWKFTVGLYIAGSFILAVDAFGTVLLYYIEIAK